MYKNRATAAGNSRALVMIDLNDEIIEMIGAPQTITWYHRINPERAIIAPVAGVFRPSIVRFDSTQREVRTRWRAAIGAPP